MKLFKKSKKPIFSLYQENLKIFWRDSFLEQLGHLDIYRLHLRLEKKQENNLAHDVWLKVLAAKAFKMDGREGGDFPQWLIEFIFFIPNIIIYPFLRTILSEYTRKPIPEEKYEKCADMLEAFKKNPVALDKFDDLLHTITRSKYHSFESENLAQELRYIEFEKTYKPIITLFKKADKLELINQLESKTLLHVLGMYHMGAETMSDQFAQILLKNKYHEIYSEFFLKDDNSEYVKNERNHYVRKPCLDDDQKRIYQHQKIELIQAYLHNQENNGKKLMIKLYDAACTALSATPDVSPPVH